MKIRSFQDDDGKSWFSGRDVCALLGFKNHSRTLSGLDNGEKCLEEIETGSGVQKLLMISEGAFASLVAASKHPLLTNLT